MYPTKPRPSEDHITGDVIIVDDAPGGGDDGGRIAARHPGGALLAGVLTLEERPCR
jgi:hypothetical protein